MASFFKRTRLFAVLMTAVTLTAALAAVLPAALTVNGDTLIFPVDSVNGTRWADTMCVYKDRPTTQQNEWGWNVVVSPEGVVTEKVTGGDIKGKNLAVPVGGFVLSGTGDIGKEMFENIDVGDHVIFDEYGMRCLASKGEVNPFYTQDIPFTHYNSVRYSEYLVVYNKAGTKTGTNGYGGAGMVAMTPVEIGGDAKIFGKSFSKLAAAATEFTSNGNDLIQKSFLLFCKKMRGVSTIIIQ